MAKVGRQGVVTMEESRTADDNLYFVEGMQFDRGYYSPYFVTDPERMVGRPISLCGRVWGLGQSFELGELTVIRGLYATAAGVLFDTCYVSIGRQCTCCISACHS